MKPIPLHHRQSYNVHYIIGNPITYITSSAILSHFSSFPWIYALHQFLPVNRQISSGLGVIRGLSFTEESCFIADSDDILHDIGVWPVDDLPNPHDDACVNSKTIAPTRPNLVGRFLHGTKEIYMRGNRVWFLSRYA